MVAITRKLAAPLAREQGGARRAGLAKLPTAQIDTEMILKAIETMRRYRLSFWDSLIIQTALHEGVTILYTEDLQHGQVIETLTVENPFRA